MVSGWNVRQHHVVESMRASGAWGSPDRLTKELGHRRSWQSSRVRCNCEECLKWRHKVPWNPQQQLDEEMPVRGDNHHHLPTYTCCAPFLWSVLAKDGLIPNLDVEWIHIIHRVEEWQEGRLLSVLFFLLLCVNIHNAMVTEDKTFVWGEDFVHL